jgi:hypothetical protein
LRALSLLIRAMQATGKDGGASVSKNNRLSRHLHKITLSLSALTQSPAAAAAAAVESKKVPLVRRLIHSSGLKAAAERAFEFGNINLSLRLASRYSI